MFEKASRIKIRFESPKGYLSVEDLWDLPLSSCTGKANLDDIARSLYKQLKEESTESFVVKDPKTNTTVQLGFDLVRHIIDVRLAEAEVLATAKANREKKQQLLHIIAQKENEQLMGSSLDELKARVESM